MWTPASRDWSVVKKVKRFLIIFYNCILVVYASTKVNSYKCCSEIMRIERNLTTLANSFDPKLKVSNMLQKFMKYWDGINSINMMLILSAIFDPRKKMHFSKLCFEKLYENIA